ncbi:MAG: T9SS type A sorting domain-containing protein [Crocinitomicaceae bacterium]|nr:T9SS type A sorting domain-containing protein [Crocinitomicaceae bacterium]
MKKLTLFFLLINLPIISNTQLINEWAGSIGSPNTDGPGNIVQDSKRNIIHTGMINGRIDYDFSDDSLFLGLNGFQIGFVQKVSPYGDQIWTKVFNPATPTGSGSIAQCIVVDFSNNIYVGGYFYGTVNFDPSGTGSTVSANSAPPFGANSLFIAKFDSNGNLIWVHDFGGDSFNNMVDLKIDSQGNIVATGRFKGTGDFDPGLSTTMMTATGVSDIYIVKLQSTGDLMWCRHFGGNYATIEDMSVDEDDHIYLCGGFSDTVDFDPGLGVANRITDGSTDAYALKIDENGNYENVISFGGSGSEYCSEIEITAYGRIIVAGTYDGTVDLDPGPNTNLFSSINGPDCFVLSLDQNANSVWSMVLEGDGQAQIYEMNKDSLDDIYLSGSFDGIVDMDPDIGVNNFSTTGSDPFIMKLDTNGNQHWVFSYGTGYESMTSTVIERPDVIYVQGRFEDTTNFDISGGQNVWVSNGAQDIYLAKYTHCLPVIYPDSVIICGDYEWVDGNIYNSTYDTASVVYQTFSGCDSIVAFEPTRIFINIGVFSTDSSLYTGNISGVFQWLNCDSGMDPIQGETNNFISPPSNGSYALEITEQGCTDTSACVDFQYVSIEDIKVIHEFSIYPNPAQDEVFIQYSNLFKIEKIILFDAMGQIVSRWEFNPNNRLDISRFSEGIYFIRFETNKGIFTYKLIKN